MTPFAIGIFLGACLLFLVQPWIGRYVLPWFGGSPGVWTVCLLFFQSALLAGYAYAHFLTQRLNSRQQALLHSLLLLGALLWLPPIPDSTWKPTDPTAPLGRLLALLMCNLGPPFVLLAATGPLLQRWFHDRFPDRSPYRLYALSNAGSLLALLSYPLWIEPRWNRGEQAVYWSLWFGVWVIALLVIAWRRHRNAPAMPRQNAPKSEPFHPTTCERIAWIGWPAMASLLLAATSNALTLDVAAVPFLWIAPLAIYLLTFIITFDRPGWYRPTGYGLALIVAGGLLLDLGIAGHGASFVALIATHLTVLFVAGMVCHGELYRTRPTGNGLTAFYLHIAAGGTLGSLFVAVIAPLLFNRLIELPLAWSSLLMLLIVRIWRAGGPEDSRWLGFAPLAIVAILPAFRAVDALRPDGQFIRSWFDALAAFSAQRSGFMMPGALLVAAAIILSLPFATGWRWRQALLRTIAIVTPVILVLGLLHLALSPDANVVHRARSFHGVHSVADYNTDNPRAAARFLAHGNTTHGIQLLHSDYSRLPTSYYSRNSGVDLALTRPRQRPGRNIALVGLGVGTLATYGQSGDTLRFFEIDPEVARIARTHFTYLRDSAARVEIVLGDGRLQLEREMAFSTSTAPRYDLIVLDAFSSDAIPLHLLTREAFDIYLARLAPNGVIAINTSNRLIDLSPVLRAEAGARGLSLATIFYQPPNESWWEFASQWTLLAPDAAALDSPEILAVKQGEPGDAATLRWTDDHSSLWSVLR